MECIAQWLDDLDDLIGAVGLIGERIRRTAMKLAVIGASLLLQIGGIALALWQPPLALATALLLFVVLLYHTVTAPTTFQHSSV